MRVIRHERVKYAGPCCEAALRLAAKPAQIIAKGLLSENALAWVITAKYEDSLPLYRQSALLGRFGGTELSRNTLAASVVRVGQAVQPVINLLRDHSLDAPLIFGDETKVQVLKEPGRPAQTQSFMWAQMTDGSGLAGTGPPIRLFGYSPSRSAAAALALYAGMRRGSVLMSDGYNNPCKNSIRPFVLGRRNWLFSDTVGGVNASANLYSLLQTCKVNGVDPYRYLAVLFTALPTAKTADDYEALLPWRIALNTA